ncbi:MAG: tetratricopeptide repeat-containing sensor histidine kinase [Candidatus Cloacimonadales bacterium]
MIEEIEKIERQIVTADTEEKFDLLTRLIRLYRKNGKSDLIPKTMAAATELLPQISNKVFLSSYYYQLALCYFYSSEYTKAQESLLKAYHLLSRQQTEELDYFKMRILLAFGVTKQKQGLHHRALSVFEKAERYAKSTKNQAYLARLQNWQAISYANLGQDDQALKLNLAALDYFQATNDQEWIANIYNSIGLIYYGLQDDKECYKYFQKAQEIHAQIDFKMGEANVLNNLGMLFRLKQEYDRALQYYQQAIEIRQKFVGNVMVSKTYINIASIYLDLKEYQKSISAIETSLALALEGADFSVEFDCYIILAYNYIYLQQPELAQKYIEKSAQLCDRLKRKKCQLKHYLLKAFFYENQKDLASALQFQKKINTLRQEINQEKIESQNKLLHKVHEYEKRQKISTIYKKKHLALAQANQQLSNSLHKLDVTNHILRHDLLNNLSVITSALKNHQRTADKSYLQHIQLRTQDSIELIKTLSTLSKTPQKIAADKEVPIDLPNLISSLMAHYPDINYQISGSGNLQTDKRLKSVLSNLIDNAIRHGKTAKINFEISQPFSQTTLKIIDFDQGIAPEIADQIFEKDFHYGATGHTGLGLFIAREIIAENNGELRYEANQPQGAIFEIILNKIRPEK